MVGHGPVMYPSISIRLWLVAPPQTPADPAPSDSLTRVYSRDVSTL